MNSEDMVYASRRICDAADQMKHAAGSIEESTRQLTFLFGEGYGNLLSQLVEELKKKDSK